ncbi:MAG TPA: hypothetical protein VL738_10055 [Dactylosporangium sp.]|jgi:hypothetical protein|nr:hypothetical protein [Dactylosporangium sp.]
MADEDEPTVLSAQWLEHRIVGTGDSERFQLHDGENVVEFSTDFGSPEVNAECIEAAGEALIEYAAKVRQRQATYDSARATYVFVVPPGALSGPG